MDTTDLTDTLSNALSNNTKEMVTTLKMLAPSPNTKSRKKEKAIHENILLTIKEIEGLQKINTNGLFDEAIADAAKTLKKLQAERTRLNSVSETLDLTEE